MQSPMRLLFDWPQASGLRKFGPMQTIRTVTAMQAWSISQRRQGVRILFVPTMGCLHAGHLSLINKARQRAGTRGRVVVSIYVNPTQFGPGEDFARYPRPWRQDRRLCLEANVDVVFAPGDDQMYPRTGGLDYSTYVVEEALSAGMEGRTRPGHFRGVTTVVAKLFHIVQPDVAVFGAKDFQQAAVVRRMARDLNFPIAILVAPTVREDDGLAMSSRNRYLNGDLRRQATVLYQALKTARQLTRAARSGLPSGLLRGRLQAMIEKQPDARVDYIEFFNPETLQPSRRAQRGVQMALAVFIGKTRLIDNGVL